MTRPQFTLAYRLLHEEHKYDGSSLPRKAVHKLLYLLNAEAQEQGLEVDIPYFWFQYGVVTPAEADIGVDPLNAGGKASGDTGSEFEAELRPIVRRVLNRYYSTSLEEVTDETYSDAPYDVQRTWRTLDKKLQTLHDNYPDFYEVEPSRNSIEESIFDVFDVFPTARFPELESDLTKWYSMITRELNRPEMDAGGMMEVNVQFWRIFSLQLAEEHRHKMSKSEVKDVLDIESFEGARESCRRTLRSIESDALAAKFDDDGQYDTPETRAADALVEGTVKEYYLTRSN
ncbi:hypothetical protein SAMN05216388_101850 [Halorientalis persicus]|uniref:Uncharacterized protein n=1 Tax=Halorientalis persicus TaxID=1367881 RepID=A0A1H8SAK7_9EURY|nr:hypothetical protein [Halorientalis persicus]SEO75546.1 hypothetical protein SAMN05216388_101850 [Halorientalis persicus]